MKWIHKGMAMCYKFKCSNCGGIAYWRLKYTAECQYPVCPWCFGKELDFKEYIAHVRFTQNEVLPYLIREIEIYCESMDGAIKDMKKRYPGCEILSVELVGIGRGSDDGQRAE